MFYGKIISSKQCKLWKMEHFPAKNFHEKQNNIMEEILPHFQRNIVFHAKVDEFIPRNNFHGNLLSTE